MKKYRTQIIWMIVAVVALVGGFFWGKSVGASAVAAGRAGAGRFALGSSTAAFAGRAGFGGAAGGGFTAGQVLSVDSDSLTLQLANGNSENVFFSSSTQISMPEPVPASSIQSGTMVMITGTTNSDGSVTASTIQVRGSASGNTGNTTTQ